MIDSATVGVVATLVMTALGALGGWLARRPKDAAEVHALAAQTDINIAAAMQTQYAKMVADLVAEVDRLRAQGANLRADIDTDKADCQKRIAAIQAELDHEREQRRSMHADMEVLVQRIEELEAAARDNGLDANGHER